MNGESLMTYSAESQSSQLYKLSDYVGTLSRQSKGTDYATKLTYCEPRLLQMFAIRSVHDALWEAIMDWGGIEVGFCCLGARRWIRYFYNGKNGRTAVLASPQALSHLAQEAEDFLSTDEARVFGQLANGKIDRIGELSFTRMDYHSREIYNIDPGKLCILVSDATLDHEGNARMRVKVLRAAP